MDASYGREDHEVATYRLEVVRADWPRKPIDVHVMSRTPSRYFQEIFPHVDRIDVHFEIAEDIDPVLPTIREAGKQAGIAGLDRHAARSGACPTWFESTGFSCSPS